MSGVVQNSQNIHKGRGQRDVSPPREGAGVGKVLDIEYKNLLLKILSIQKTTQTLHHQAY